ncbi:MAG: pyruvate kinase [Schleiferiaceae bacterium]|nr:pyruvate kinase [Schleiferiaceae bacterium]
MNQNKAKIVATLGPASSSEEMLLALVDAGVNVFRVNFSHGAHAGHIEVIQRIQRLRKEKDFAVAILADLQGPKLRIGDVEEGTVVNIGDIVHFTSTDHVGNAQSVYMNYHEFPRDVKPGETILLDDGKLMMEVLETNKTDLVKTKVIQGGPLKSKKGVNLPNTKISLPCLTKKDLADLEVALDQGVEWIGLSFVRNSEDVIELRRLINERKSPAKIVSKIEKPEAIIDIDNIIEESDALMVARGDLGVEIPMQGVPLIQKLIVEKSLEASKPVIIATQMMESMIESMSPTRAEVNDVANSILDGADAVMLSGETSVGKYPVHVVKAMRKIISHVEESAATTGKNNVSPKFVNKRYITDSICFNASKIADQVGARAILTMTFSGYTAYRLSSHRPKAKIHVFTANHRILNTLSLVWGVECHYYDNMISTDQTFDEINAYLKDKGRIAKGDLIINIASMPIKDSGMTNMLKLDQVK